MPNRPTNHRCHVLQSLAGYRLRSLILVPLAARPESATRSCSVRTNSFRSRVSAHRLLPAPGRTSVPLPMTAVGGKTDRLRCVPVTGLPRLVNRVGRVAPFHWQPGTVGDFRTFHVCQNLRRRCRDIATSQELELVRSKCGTECRRHRTSRHARRPRSADQKWRFATRQSPSAGIEVAMLREELRINGARMQRVPPHRRPQDTAVERMAILQLRATRGWNKAETSRRFSISDDTIRAWLRRADDDSLVDTHTPVIRVRRVA